MNREPTLALCAIMKNEADYVEEWLAFHLLQGASQFVLYDNRSTDDTRVRARRFATRANLAIVPWPDSGGGFDLTQRLAYADGARRLAGRVDFAAFIDLDEFLYADDGGSLQRALGSFPPDVAAIAVNQRVFGSSGHVKAGPGFVTSRFTVTAAPGYPEAHWFKTIAKPDRILGFDSVHSVVLRAGAYVLTDGRVLPPRPEHPGCSPVIARGAISLNHYMLKSREEFERKKRRWTGQDLADRLGDDYFAGRDAAINDNAVRDARLRDLAPRVAALIDAVRRDASGAGTA